MSFSSWNIFGTWLVCYSMQICWRQNVNGEDCRDHPRFGSACKNVHNLREWCDRSRLQDDSNQNSLAQVCRATCGFCNRNSGKAAVLFETGSSESDEKYVKAPQPGDVDREAFTQPKKQSRENLFVLAKPLVVQPHPQSRTRPLPTTSPPVPTAPCGQPPKYAPCVPLEYSNLFFQQCCRDSGIGPACLHLCRYDVKVEEVQLAHVKQQCPFSILPAYFTCASRTKNNTDCCRDTGILADTGPQCTPFCDPAGTPFGTIGLRHWKCAVNLEEIMQCHWAGLR